MNRVKRIWINEMNMASKYIVKVIVVFFVITVLYGVLVTESNDYPTRIPIEYIEDKSGALNVEDVSKIESTQFYKKEDTEISFGRSQSYWWIRFKLKDLPKYSEKNHLLIYNPTLADAKLYIPTKENSETIYKIQRSGWRYGLNRQDEGFYYPTFQLEKGIETDEYIYLRLFSTFTQNYDIKFFTDKDFTAYRDQRNVFIGGLFGIFFAIIIFNAIIFIEIRDKAYFWYVVYLGILLLYEGNLLGVVTVYLPKLYTCLMSNTITLSLLVMWAALNFLKSFFRIEALFPEQKKVFIGLTAAVGIGLFLDFATPSTWSNFYAHNFSIVGSCYMIYMGIKALNKGYSQAKFFLAGWLIVILSLIISLARHIGIMPNNAITINVTVIAFAIHTIFLSAAFIDRIKVLAEEKETAEIKFRSAEETAELNEIMFLQAQIKPHFLYNALNVIATLCRMDAERARMLILDLSQYLHHTFSYKSENYQSSLESELKYVEAYVNIEQARFKDKINVIYEIDEVDQMVIPSMSIQPLVENAIRHGLRKGSGSGTIIVRIVDEENRIRIEVEDNGIGLTKAQVAQVNCGGPSLSGGIGLTNINRRLNRLYASSLVIESELGKGTNIRFWIPK